MYVELQDNIIYTEYEKEMTKYLYHVCFNLIIKTEICFNTPVYSITLINENNTPITIHENLRIQESLTKMYSFPAKEIYDKIVNSLTNIEDNFLKYERIFKTLHNPNNIVQFMSLYQYLMELLQG